MGTRGVPGSLVLYLKASEAPLGVDGQSLAQKQEEIHPQDGKQTPALQVK